MFCLFWIFCFSFLFLNICLKGNHKCFKYLLLQERWAIFCVKQRSLEIMLCGKTSCPLSFLQYKNAGKPSWTWTSHTLFSSLHQDWEGFNLIHFTLMPGSSIQKSKWRVLVCTLSISEWQKERIWKLHKYRPPMESCPGSQSSPWKK